MARITVINLLGIGSVLVPCVFSLALYTGKIASHIIQHVAYYGVDYMSLLIISACISVCTKMTISDQDRPPAGRSA